MQEKTRVRFSRSEWLLLFVLAATQFNHIVDFMILMPLGPQLRRIFGISPHEFGLLVSSYTFSAGLTGFAASLFIDRFDRKKCLLFFYTGFTLGTIACALAPTYVFLLIARSLAGAFGGVLGSLGLSIVADAIPYQRRGTAMGILMGSFSVASVIGVPFSLYLANHFGWHAPFLFLGLMSLIALGLIMLFVPSMRGHLRADGFEHKPWQSLTHILRTPNQQLGLAFMFLLVFGQFAIIPFMSPSFVANTGLTEAQLPLIYLFGGLCSMVASPGVGRLSDQFGKKKVFSLCVTLSMFPMFFVTNLGVNPTWIVLLVSSSFFVAMSGRMVPAMAMVSATATPEFRGSFMSIISSIQQLAMASSSYIAGLIVLDGGGGRLINYEYVGYVAMVFSAFALLAVRRLHTGEGQSSQLEVL
ncbi:MAG: MFS transporter [Bdellovibrionaceae bacterium]|nr:MFS transporter [Pseudobdellovibrionaceae bacterium]MBX3033957.1 MFS transporter [Pseudobdellovibrionaceae bacterium]